MFGRKSRRPSQPRSTQLKPLIESLEPRQLLSAVADAVLRSDAVVLHPSATSATVQGYTPSQIRHAYGFDQLKSTATGAGQTIAIVDAYNDPNISADLNVFDSQFGLVSPPSLKVVSQTGTSKLPTTDAGWSGEIALDVEWAHAVAPQASILLVEASSSTVQDLMAAVDYARHASGVSVVSMSWGGSEFFNWNGSEFTGQTQYDPIFTTPSSHQGVTFVAAAGDSGSFYGVQWPASSTNVVSVGGTSLNMQDVNGTYLSESSWSGTSGGFSQVEAEPSYQSGVNSTGARSSPDVAYNADPNTGFAVYDSVPDQGYSGWQVVGGTSAGAPQWAALIAIADQARVASALATLDGASQTLPILYSLYGAPGTAAYTSYTSYFHDVIDGGGNGWHWRWGWGYTAGQASIGYDTATGLGSPIAANVISALAGGSSSSSTGSPGSPGSSGTGGSTPTTPAQLPASQLSGTFIGSLPTTVIGGTSGSVRLKITNTAASKFTGPISVSLYASTDGSLSADDTLITTLTVPKLTLAGGASKVVRVKFDYPTDLPDGSYSLIASIDETAQNVAAATAVSTMPVTIDAPTADLSTTFAGNQTAVPVNPGHDGSVAVTITNLGNVTATGDLTVSLYASSSPTLDSSAVFLAAVPLHRISLRPGRSITVHIRFTAPANQQGGTYNLIASTVSSTQPADTNAANDIAVIPTR